MSVLNQLQRYSTAVKDSTTPRIPGTEGWQAIRTIDMHTGGEPLRVIVDGFPAVEGDCVLECRRFLKENHDHLRTALMFEPRGHADMYGCLLVAPNDSAADFGIIFLHNEGYSTMCGHAIIAISKLVFQMGWRTLDRGENVLRIDAPCGRITSFTENIDGSPGRVRFHGVPSFVVGLDRTVDVPGVGTVTYDLAYGGAFYAYVDLNKNAMDFDLTAAHYRQIVQTGMDIKRAVMAHDKEIVHPFEPDLSFLYGTIFIDDSPRHEIDSRNVCVFADGEVDRCPTGSGISGRMAIHFSRNEVRIGETMKIESIVESVFSGSVARQVKFGRHNCVVPEVSGTAHIVGQNTFLFDPGDPLGNGFILH